MKLNAGIITDRLSETKSFYTTVHGMTVAFENDFYLLLTNIGGDQLSFLLPNHPTQAPVFQSAFTGKGVYLTLEVPNVDEVHKQIQDSKVPVIVALRDEPWGDRHFAILDPNGIGVDIVTYNAP